MVIMKLLRYLVYLLIFLGVIWNLSSVAQHYYYLSSKTSVATGYIIGIDPDYHKGKCSLKYAYMIDKKVYQNYFISDKERCMRYNKLGQSIKIRYSINNPKYSEKIGPEIMKDEIPYYVKVLIEK